MRKFFASFFNNTRNRVFIPIFVGLLITVVISLMFTKPTQVRADSTIGMNEGYGTTVGDSSGTITGTITGATWKAEEFCKVGKCLFFDGSGDFVNFGNDSDVDFTTGSFTIEAWFRHAPKSSGTDIIVGKILNSDNDGGYQLQMESDGDITCEIDDVDADTTIDDSATSTAATYDDNQWHFATCVKSGTSSLTLYIDGIQVAQDSSLDGSGSLTNDDTFYIGIDGDGSSNPYTGFLDEVKVYAGTARTAAEIKADFAGATDDRGVSASFGPDQSYITNGLVGYWKSEESSTPSLDSSGNGSSGTWGNNITSNAGKFNRGSEFDGTGDYIDAGTGANLHNLGPMTFSSWFKSDTYGEGNRGRFFQSAPDGSGNRSLYMCSSCTGNLVFEVDFSDTNLLVETAASVFSHSVWNHIAVTWDGGTSTKGVFIYINGIRVSHRIETDATGTVVADTGQNFYIGNRPASTIRSFDGIMDDIRVYNRALSPAEIAKIYAWAPGPAAHWKMDENTGSTTINDSSASGYTATLTGITETNWVHGKYGSGLNLDGSSQYATTSETSAFSTDLFTFESWVYPTTTGTEQNIIDNRDGSGDGSRLSIQNTNAFRCDYNAVNSTSTTTISINTWYHVACTSDGNTMKIYVNGTLEDSDSLSGSISETTAARIGAQAASAASYFQGIVDDVLIYTYARTPLQVVEDMNGGHPSPGSPIGSAVGHWRFDEGSLNACPGGTDDFCDASVNGNHLSYSGSSGGITNSGKFGKAYDGADNTRITRADDADFDFSNGADDFTLSLWFNRGGAVSNQEYLLDKHATNDGYTIYMDSDGDIVCGIGDGAAAFPEETIGGSLSANYDDTSWHNAVCVKSGTSSLRLYVDGREIASDTSLAVTEDMSNTGKLIIADTNETDGTDEWLGDIDEVQIYRSALPTDSVKALYNQGSSVVMGATSTDSAGNASWSSQREYCPPGNTETNCAVGQNPAPVAEWKMDEKTGTTLRDTSGNNNNSTTWVGNTKYAPGYSGSGLYFDGVDDVVQIAESATTDLGGASDSYTVSAWFKTSTTATNNKAIVSKIKDGEGGATPFHLYYAGSPKIISFDIDDGPTNCNSGSGGPTVGDGKWHHAAGVWNTSTDTTYVYVDGVLVDFDSCGATGTFSNNDDISIGNARDANPGPDYLNDDFEGYIDNVRIYNYVRTPTQISWEVGRGKPIGWWKMDETSWTNDCSTDTVFDSSGNGFHGDACPASTGPIGGATGKFNNAGDFDGSNDYITMGDVTFFDSAISTTRDFSVAGWFYRDTFDTDDTIVGKRAVQLTGNNGFLVWIDDSTDKLTFEACDTSGASCDEYMMESVSTFTATGWNHFAVVWDDDNESNTKIYINGVAENVTRTCLVGGGPTTCVFSDIDGLDNVRQFRIGAQHDGNNPFDGKLDDIMLFGYVLNTQQLTGLYRNGPVFFGPNEGSP